MATRLSNILLGMMGTAASQQLLGRGAGGTVRKRRRTTKKKTTSRKRRRSSSPRKKSQAQIKAERLKNLAKARRARKRKARK